MRPRLVATLPVRLAVLVSVLASLLAFLAPATARAQNCPHGRSCPWAGWTHDDNDCCVPPPTPPSIPHPRLPPPPTHKRCAQGVRASCAKSEEDADGCCPCATGRVHLGDRCCRPSEELSAGECACPAGTMLDGDACVPRDPDGDGVLGKADACPKQPEDFDGVDDADGCPDLDDDHDGVPDARDACRDAPEDRNHYRDDDGCPDEPERVRDDDHDGVILEHDDCPSEAEDRDGFEDGNGCPEPDNDHDGIPDTADCDPLKKEDENGYHDADGCPDETELREKRAAYAAAKQTWAASLADRSELRTHGIGCVVAGSVLGGIAIGTGVYSVGRVAKIEDGGVATGKDIEGLVSAANATRVFAVMTGVASVTLLATGLPLLLTNLPTEEPRLELGLAPGSLALTGSF